MIVVRIKGGLGNQLFQYACGYALSQRLNDILYLDDSFFAKQSLRGYKLKFLNITGSKYETKLPWYIRLIKNKYVNYFLRISNVSTIKIGKWTYLLETKSDIVKEFFTIVNSNIYVDGYFQSEKYFKEYADDLRKQFSILKPFAIESLENYDIITKSQSVAIHVRRGDFLKVQFDKNPNHYLLGSNYYCNSLKYILQHVKNPIFFCFSDDIEWVKNNLNFNEPLIFVSISGENADLKELFLMSHCKHIIAANSTFSWWSSWLNSSNDSMHICPKKRYGNLQMIPDSWVKIEV